MALATQQQVTKLAALGVFGPTNLCDKCNAVCFGLVYKSPDGRKEYCSDRCRNLDQGKPIPTYKEHAPKAVQKVERGRKSIGEDHFSMDVPVHEFGGSTKADLERYIIDALESNPKGNWGPGSIVRGTRPQRGASYDSVVREVIAEMCTKGTLRKEGRKIVLPIAHKAAKAAVSSGKATRSTPSKHSDTHAVKAVGKSTPNAKKGAKPTWQKQAATRAKQIAKKRKG